MAKVTVIVSTKNNQEVITYLLKSLACQSFKAFEVLLVDFCSTDATLVKAQEFPVKIFRLNFKEQNLAKTLNLALDLSQGEIIFSLEGGSVPLSNNYLAASLKVLAQKKAAVCFGPQIKNQETPIVKLINPNHWPKVMPKTKKISLENPPQIYLANCAFKKNIWQKYYLENFGEIFIWQWIKSIIGEGQAAYYLSEMIVQKQGKIGFFNYFEEIKLFRHNFEQFKKESLK